MFSIFIDRQADIWLRLLNLYFPNKKPSVIDFTFGTGSNWRGVPEKRCSRIVRCDARPVPSLRRKYRIKKRDLAKDSYSDLGKFDAALFDPPYLIGRSAFDYKVKVSNKNGALIPLAYQGPHAWAAQGNLKNFVENKTPEEFNARVKALNEKLPSVLKREGLLFVKVMDTSYKGKMIAHHISIANLLTNFELKDIGVYVRQGSTTWVRKAGLQRLHGYWLIFARK